MIQAQVIFKGRVQGVWFRAYTQEQAIRSGLTGWVRNCRDGSVEAVFEGEKEAILGVIHWLKTQHPHARVSEAVIDWRNATGKFDGFSVR